VYFKFNKHLERVVCLAEWGSESVEWIVCEISCLRNLIKDLTKSLDEFNESFVLILSLLNLIRELKVVKIVDFNGTCLVFTH